MLKTENQPLALVRRGFTLVELLIVIVVIAILAAISVVAYNGIQNRTYDAIVQSDLSNLSKKMEIYAIENGNYPDAPEELNLPGFRITRDAYDATQNNAYYSLNKSEQVYAFGLRSKSGNGFILRNGAVEKVSTVNGLATAEAAGFASWGAADYTRQLFVIIDGKPATSSSYDNGWVKSSTWIQ